MNAKFIQHIISFLIVPYYIHTVLYIILTCSTMWPFICRYQIKEEKLNKNMSFRRLTVGRPVQTQYIVYLHKCDRENSILCMYLKLLCFTNSKNLVPGSHKSYRFELGSSAFQTCSLQAGRYYRPSLLQN